MSTVKKKKKKKSSSGPPAWLLPALGGFGVLVVILVVVLVFGKSLRDGFRGMTADSSRAIPADADKVVVIRPKSMSGTSGFGVGDMLQGGGAQWAPNPPKGFGLEKGQIDEAWRVYHGGKQFDVLRAIWKMRVESGVTLAATERGFRVYDCKGRFVVPNGNDLLVFQSQDDAKAAIGRMLDSKTGASYLPKERTPAMYHAGPGVGGTMKDVLNERKGPDLPTPKFTHAEMQFVESDYHVNYNFNFGTAEEAAKAHAAIKASRTAIEEEKKKFWADNAANIEPGRNPYSEWERRAGIPIEVDGANIKYKLPFWKMTQAPGQPLVTECFGLGDLMDDEEAEGDGKKPGKRGLPIPGAG